MWFQDNVQETLVRCENQSATSSLNMLDQPTKAANLDDEINKYDIFG
jgi:hypothetical protein